MFRVIFFGTSEFAVPSLSTLLEDPRFQVVGIVTQPDRPVGRHAQVSPPPVKASLSLSDAAHAIPVFQPEKISDPDFDAWIRDIGPSCDVFVVIAYGKILPQWLIDLPKKGVVNVHGSILPRWRGAAPIQAAIAAGDHESGVTVMLVDTKLDHGPILGIESTTILDRDTGQELHDRLALLGQQILPDILAGYLEGQIQPREQEHDLATTCYTLNREDGKLDFTKTSLELERQIRAYHPWPGSWMEYQGKRLKIHAAQYGKSTTETPGTIFRQDGKVFLACAKDTSLELQLVQREGKTVQPATSLF